MFLKIFPFLCFSVSNIVFECVGGRATLQRPKSATTGFHLSHGEHRSWRARNTSPVPVKRLRHQITRNVFNNWLVLFKLVNNRTNVIIFKATTVFTADKEASGSFSTHALSSWPIIRERGEDDLHSDRKWKEASQQCMRQYNAYFEWFSINMNLFW